MTRPVKELIIFTERIDVNGRDRKIDGRGN